MIQAGINGNKYDNMNPKTLSEPQMTVNVTPKITPKRQRMTLKRQRMTPRMVNMTPKMTQRTELLQMIYKRLTMTQ